MMIKKNFIAALSALLMSANTLLASDTLVYYAFTSNSQPTIVDSMLTASSWQNGSGRSALYGHNVVSGALSLKGYGSNLATVWNSKRFVYITLTAQEGQYLQLDSLTFDLSVNSSWDLNFVGVSTGIVKDSAAAWVSTSENYAFYTGAKSKGTQSAYTVYFDSTHINISSVDIRLYMDGKAGQGYNFDNLTVYGKPGAATAKLNQQVNLTTINDRFLSDGDMRLLATTTSGLPVSYAVLSGPATLYGGDSLTFSDTGQVCVVAAQQGNAQYNAAQDTTVCFNVKDLNTSSAANLTVIQVQVYPNPASDNIHVVVGDDMKVNSIKLTTMAGKVVRSVYGNLHTLNVAGLSAGVYVIEIEHTEGAYRGNLLIK